MTVASPRGQSTPAVTEIAVEVSSLSSAAAPSSGHPPPFEVFDDLLDDGDEPRCPFVVSFPEHDNACPQGVDESPYIVPVKT